MSDPWGGNSFATANTSPFNSPFSSPKVDALAPYVEEEKAKRAEKFSLLQPVKWIFDILQRGQYLTANVGEEIIKSIRTGEPLGQSAMDALGGALEGITGKRKGDWQKVLFGGQTEGEGEAFNGLFPDAKIPTWAKKVIGFAANVALDPTSYISFGATKVATNTAKVAAEQAVKIEIQSLVDAGKLAVGIGGRAKDLVGKGIDDVVKYVDRFDGTLSRTLNNAYKSTYRDSLHLSGPEIQEMMKAKFAEKGLAPEANVLEDLVMGSPILAEIGKGYGTGAGQRALKLGPLGIGQELFTHQSGKPMQIWDQARKTFGQTGIGKKLGDAWYAITVSNTAARILRNAFGIRQPFEQILNQNMRSATEGASAAASRMRLEAWNIGQSIPDELKQPLQSAYFLHEELKNAPKLEAWVPTLDGMIRDPSLTEQIVKRFPKDSYVQKLLKDVQSVGDKEALANAAGQIHGLADDWMRVTRTAESMGILKAREIPEYLARIYRSETTGMGVAGAGAGFNKGRKITGMQGLENQMGYFQWLFGVDKQTAEYLTREKGMSALVTDLPSMLAYRAEAAGRLESKIAIVNDFKQFGIPISEIQDASKQFNLTGLLQNRNELQEVSGDAFKNMLFPKEVAEVLNRTQQATSDPGMRGFMRIWGGFTNWWKGMVTMTSGFHIRNWMQNNITDYLHHGLSAFNPRTQGDALAATIYALAKDNPKPWLEKIAKTQDWYLRALQHNYGGKTVQELADYSLQKGVISHFTQAFDPQTFGQFAKQGTANPLSQKFYGTLASRKVGEIIENQARFHFMLGEVSQLKGAGTRELDFAALEAKKWLFDYNDLTEFERSTLKNIIPFYSWLRKNIPAQIATITTNPSIYSLFPKAEEAIQGAEIPDEAIPDWLRAVGAIAIGADDNGNPIFWNPNLAFQDLNKIPLLFPEGGGVPKLNLQETIDDIVGAAHPMLKQIVQQIPKEGYDIFYKRDLNYDAPAPYVMQFFAKNPKTLAFLGGLSRVLGNEDFFVVDNEGKLRMPAKAAKLFEDNLPLLRMIERTMKVPQAAIPGLDQAITGASESKLTGVDQMSQFFKLLSYWGGAKFNIYDVQKEKERYAADVKAAAQATKSRKEKYSPTSVIRKVKASETAKKWAARHGL